MVPCEVGLDAEQCGAHEECVPPNNRSKSGVCECKPGFARGTDGDDAGKCVEGERAPYNLLFGSNQFDLAVLKGLVMSLVVAYLINK